MCRSVPRLELTRSRLRWRDVPALLLLHRPWRCVRCGDRLFYFWIAQPRRRLLDRLWMHYGLLTFLGALSLIVLWNGPRVH